MHIFQHLKAIWYEEHTPGQMAKFIANEFETRSGRVVVTSRRAKKGGISGAKSVTRTFYFHDGIAKMKRKTKVGTRNGMCPHCKFLSVEQDIYLAIGPHPEAGKVTSGEGAEISAIIARFGNTWACNKCKRDLGLTHVQDERTEIWTAPWTGYCDEDNPKHWHHVEPLPAKFKEDTHLDEYIQIDTYWCNITTIRPNEEERL